MVATDVDERAVGLREGETASRPPRRPVRAAASGLDGRVDVVAAVVPYVPTPDLALLQRDTFAFESALSYDGGQDGTDVLRRVIAGCPRYLRRGGALLLELGGSQADLLAEPLARLGFVAVAVLSDVDGDVRGIEATSVM